VARAKQQKIDEPEKISPYCGSITYLFQIPMCGGFLEKTAFFLRGKNTDEDKDERHF